MYFVIIFLYIFFQFMLYCALPTQISKYMFCFLVLLETFLNSLFTIICYSCFNSQEAYYGTRIWMNCQLIWLCTFSIVEHIIFYNIVSCVRYIFKKKDFYLIEISIYSYICKYKCNFWYYRNIHRYLPINKFQT